MKSPFLLVVHHAHETSRAHTDRERAAPVAGVLRRYYAACRPNTSIRGLYYRPVTKSLQKHDRKAVEITERDGKKGARMLTAHAGQNLGFRGQ